MTSIAKPDPRETHVRITSPRAGLTLFLRHLPPLEASSQSISCPMSTAAPSPPPCPLPIALTAVLARRTRRRRFPRLGPRPVWLRPFRSLPRRDPSANLAFTQDASRQLSHTHHLCAAQRPKPVPDRPSWGTMVAAHVAEHRSDLIDRMGLGPIAQRQPTNKHRNCPQRLITLQDQWDRFTADVPPCETQVLSKRPLTNRPRPT